MSLVVWIVLFLLGSLLWVWIIWWGGDEWLEGSALSGFLVSTRAPRWTADGIRVFAMLSWLGQAIWFVVGVFLPEVRPWR